ncbi:MAG: hypothetical protein WBE34_20825, partial [Candidatus Nitrosopolaris sp.]
LNFGKPIVFDITIPNTVRNTEGAIQFVKFLFSDQGKTIFENDGFKLLPLTAVGNDKPYENPNGIDSRSHIYRLEHDCINPTFEFNVSTNNR